MPAVDQGRGHHGELQGRRGEVALADAEDRGFPLLPRFAEAAQLPVLRRDEPLAFTGQAEAADLAETEPAGHPLDGVHAQPQGHLVEIDVTGLFEGGDLIDMTMAAPLPAVERRVAELQVARAEHRFTSVGGALCQGGQGDDRLER